MLAALLEDHADRGGLSLGDNEHAGGRGMRTQSDKRGAADRDQRRIINGVAIPRRPAKLYARAPAKEKNAVAHQHSAGAEKQTVRTRPSGARAAD